MDRRDGGRGSRRRPGRRRRTGVYGHRVTMLDSRPGGPGALPRDGDDRRLRGPPAGRPDRAGALGLGRAEQDPALTRPTATSSSASTSAPTTREEACRILGELMRDKALATRSRARPPAVGGQARAPGTPSGDKGRQAGEGRHRRSRGRRTRCGRASMEVIGADGSARVLYAGTTPRRTRAGASSTGSSPTRSAASSPTRATCSTPPGRRPTAAIVPLDGFLDPYFQEVYLDTDSIPLFSTARQGAVRRTRSTTTSTQLEHEVWKYTRQGPELRQGRAADVQHLPPDRPVRARRPTSASCSTSRSPRSTRSRR